MNDCRPCLGPRPKNRQSFQPPCCYHVQDVSKAVGAPRLLETGHDLFEVFFA